MKNSDIPDSDFDVNEKWLCHTLASCLGMSSGSDSEMVDMEHGKDGKDGKGKEDEDEIADAEDGKDGKREWEGKWGWESGGVEKD